MYWLARHYTRQPADLPGQLQFDVEAIPRPLPASVRKQRQDELKAQAERFAAQDAELAAMREQSATLEQELADLRAQVAAAKAANEARPDDHDYDEAATRDLFIDLLLRRQAGRSTSRGTASSRSPACPTTQGTGFVDYVLWGDDGKPLGLVEAKRTRRDAAVGQQQAKLYADCLEAAYRAAAGDLLHQRLRALAVGRRGSYPPRQVQGFYTKDELAAADPAPHARRRKLAEHGDQRPRSWSGTTSTGRSAGSARRSRTTSSAMRWW